MEPFPWTCLASSTRSPVSTWKLHIGGEARAQCSALCHRGLSEACTGAEMGRHVARIDPKPLLRLTAEVLGGRTVASSRLAGSRVSTTDSGLVSCLRACISASDSLWYPTAAHERCDAKPNFRAPFQGRPTVVHICRLWLALGRFIAASISWASKEGSG